MPNIQDMMAPEDYPAWKSLDEETQENLRNHAAEIKKFLQRSFKWENEAKAYLAEQDFSNDELLGLWCILESFEKTALNRHNH